MHCHFTQKLRILALSRMNFEELHLWNNLTSKTNSQATELKYFIAKESKETKWNDHEKIFSISGHKWKKRKHSQNSFDEELYKFGL